MTFNINVYDTCYKKYTISFIAVDDAFYDLDNPIVNTTIFFKNRDMHIDIRDPVLMNKGTT